MHKFKIIVGSFIVATGILMGVAFAQSEFPFLYHAHDASGQLQKAVDTVNDRLKSAGVTNDTDRVIRGDQVQVATSGVSLVFFAVLDGTNLVSISTDLSSTNTIDADIGN